MQIISFMKNVKFDEKKVIIDVLNEDDYSKEIRIIFKKNQIMKEHKAKFPISVMCIEGEIKFSTKDSECILQNYDMISLEGNTLHELYANKDSVVRLTLHKTNNTKN